MEWEHKLLDRHLEKLREEILKVMDWLTSESQDLATWCLDQLTPDYIRKR
jgi:hypothetical protein